MRAIPARARALLAIVAFSVGTASCGGGGGEGILVEAFTMAVSPSDLTLSEGSTGLIAVVVSGGRQGAAPPTLRSCQTAAPNVATAAVDATGCRVTAVSAGSSTVTATLTDGQARSANVTVSPLPVALSGVTVNGGTVLVGQTLTLVPSPVTTTGGVVGVAFAYTSTNPSIATVSATGVVTGVAPGTTTITVAATGTGIGVRTNTVTTTASITVNPLPPSITALSVSGGALLVGATLPLTPSATRASTGVSVSYSFSSSAPAVASVDGSTGVVTAVTAGTAVITVTAVGVGSGFTTTSLTATASIVVTALPDAVSSVTITPTTGAVMIGELLRLGATAVRAGPSVTLSLTYSSSAPTVASVNTTTGVVTGVGAGTATITVTATGSGVGFANATKTASAVVTVSSSTLGLGFGDEQFVAITNTTFSRGSQTGNSDELPVRRVTLTSFRVQKTEVTQAQWRQVMTGTTLANPSAFASCGDTCPVERVTWENVQLFLTRLNQQDPGKAYRLPTEAQWEFAARGLTTGDEIVPGQPIDAIAWIQSNSGGRTARVGQKLPNGLGLYDVLGNVWEWVSDWYDASYYGTGPDFNPTGPATGTERVIRGSSWFFGAQLARPSLREKFPPGFGTDALGFRLVRN